MLKKWTAILLILLISCDVCLSVNYSNYTLFRAIPVDEEQLKFLEQLSDLYNVNFWRPPGSLDVPVEFSIGPDQLEDFKKDVESRDIYATTISDDIQSMFDEQTIRFYMRRQMETFNWQGYYLLDDIYNWLYDLQHLYRTHINVYSIGKTALGRDILAATIVLPESKNRSKVIIEGGIHAREWISPAVVTYLINELVHAPQSQNSRWKTIALTYEWYIVPILNPDGYEYSHTRDRLWRKNRRGVDINRNFDSQFGTVGVSRSPTSETYCGESAFSEQESLSMKHYVEDNSENLEYYLGFHSYGQFMILPYAYKKSHEENYNEVSKKCRETASAISRRYGTKYTFGTAYETVGYMTSGASSCWVKGTFNPPYVVVFELRDDGKYGFALPPHLIMPTCLETMDGLLTLLAPGYMVSGVSGCWVKATFNTPYVVIFELRDDGIYGFSLPPHLIMPTCLETMDGLLTLLAPGYMISGISSCWVKGTFKTPYVVLFELRDDGSYGFALPPHLIMPTCLETMDGLLTLLAPADNITIRKAPQKKSGKIKKEEAHDGEGRKVFDKATLLFNVIIFILLKN